MSKEQSQLERDTEAYFENLSGAALQEERELEKALCGTSRPDPDTEE
jgi:hypothetical protein